MKDLWVIFFLAISMAASAQAADDPLGVGHTHEGDIGKFYQSWQRPNFRDNQGQRYSSCCGGHDCRPILAFREHPGGFMYWPIQNQGQIPAKWEIFTNNLSGGQQWYVVPDSLWEDVQPDPRESPDERGHVCVTYSDFVICAVRASGQ